MSTSASLDPDPATLDVVTPEHYERTAIRTRSGRGCAATTRSSGTSGQRRPVLGDHQARRHHRDRQAAGDLPERAAPRGVHQRPAAAAGGRSRATCSTWTRPTTPATGASPAAGSRRAPSARMDDKVARVTARGARRRRREKTAGDFVRDVSAPHHHRGDRRDARRAAPRLGAAVPLDERDHRAAGSRVPARHDRRTRRSSGARLELFTYFNDLVRASAARGRRDDIVSVVANGEVERRAAAARRAAVLLLPARRRRQRDDAQRHDRRHARVPRESRRVAEAAPRSRRCSTARSRRSCAGRRR